MVEIRIDGLGRTGMTKVKSRMYVDVDVKVKPEKSKKKKKRMRPAHLSAALSTPVQCVCVWVLGCLGEMPACIHVCARYP